MILKKQQAGFTLIELMITVAIIGILAAITIPAYQNYVEDARISSCEGEVKAQTNIWLIEYSQDPTIANLTPAVTGACASITLPTATPADASGTVATSWVTATANDSASTTITCDGSGTCTAP